jgi:hypothetical protein
MCCCDGVLAAFVVAVGVTNTLHGLARDEVVLNAAGGPAARNLEEAVVAPAVVPAVWREGKEGREEREEGIWKACNDTSSLCSARKAHTHELRASQ